MDVISVGLQSGAVFIGFGKSFFKGEIKLLGIEGRKLARICLIASVGLLAADQTREAIKTKSPVQINGAAILWTIAGRSLLLVALPNLTTREKKLRQVVSDGAFVIGTSLSISGQLADAGSVATLPTIFAAAGLWFGCQMDRQDKQENANRLLLGAGSCMFAFGCLSGSPGIVAQTFTSDICATGLNTYRNYVRNRYDGSVPEKIRAYVKDTMREALAGWG